MPLLPGPTLTIPAAAFALLAALAGVNLATAASSPRARLVTAAGAYARAVSRGDLSGALAFHDGPAPRELEAWVANERGLLGQIVAAVVSPDGREARVEVLWLDADSRPRITEAQTWERGPGAGWHLANLEVQVEGRGR